MSEVSLNLAHRNMLKAVFTVLSGVDDVDTESVLMIADITEALDLEAGEESVQALEREVRLAYIAQERVVKQATKLVEKAEKGTEPVSKSLYEDLDTAQAKLDVLPVGLSYAKLLKGRSKKYNLEKGALDWLVSTLKDYKWNVVLSRDPMSGQVEAIKKTLATDEAVAAAGLIRAIKAASL